MHDTNTYNALTYNRHTHTHSHQWTYKYGHCPRRRWLFSCLDIWLI